MKYDGLECFRFTFCFAVSVVNGWGLSTSKLSGVLCANADPGGLLGQGVRGLGPVEPEAWRPQERCDGHINDTITTTVLAARPEKMIP